VTSFFTARRVIRGGLFLQMALVAILLGRGLVAAWPTIAWPSTQPQFDVPVQPGNQTRRFNPSNMPLRPAEDGNPDRPFRSTGDMPDRLAFSQDGDVLTLTGSIMVGDADRLIENLTDDVTQVRLNSPGGSVYDALSIGQSIRDAGITTSVTQGDICLSACPYILAAGTERVVHTDAQVGVHQHSFGTSSALPAFLAVAEIQRGQAEVMVYLDQMGVDPLLMQHAMKTPAKEIYILLNDQLQDYNLATEIMD